MSDAQIDDLAFASATSLIAQLANGTQNPTELAHGFVNQIADLDDGPEGYNSVLAIADNYAESAATAAGQLAGIPILIKDNIEAIGLPATAGSLSLAGRTVTRNAKLVDILKSNGAVIIGSTNLSEWANFRSPHSVSGWSAVGGLTHNPWKHGHSAGGSSSGSGAAVAAGLIPFAIGTETDGSIVCPASLNGCVGIKPTVGTVSTQGVIPLSASQDTAGPLARNVKDAALLLDILSGLNTSRVLQDDSPLTVGFVREWLTMDEQANAVFESALQKLSQAGIKIVEIDVPTKARQAADDEGTVLIHEIVEDLSHYLAERPGEGVTSLADVVEFNRHNDRELEIFGQEYFEFAIASGGRNAKYREARERNLLWATRQVLAPALENVDVLIGMLYAGAWKSDLVNGDDYRNASWMTQAPAVAGWPLASVPMGFVDGLPLGLGVASRALDEVGLVRALARIERALGLGVLRPPTL